jgi:hypothetical protein
MAEAEIAAVRPDRARGSNAKGLPGAKLTQLWFPNAGSYVIG